MENNIDKTIVDGVKLVVGNEYYIKYIHTINSNWKLIKITKITIDGYCWSEGKNSNGIISNGNYLIQELTDKNILEQFAREWLNNENYSGFGNHTIFPKLFSLMYIDFKLHENSLQTKLEI